MAKKSMGTKITNFANDAPLLSLFYLAVVGFTAVDVMSSFTLPRGNGPFSPKSNLGASTSTTTSTSSSHPPIVRESLQEHGGGGMSGLHGLGMTKSQIAAKHPKGTKKSHINRMHHHMERGMEFGPAHNRAVSDGYPAMGSYALGNALGHCNCASPSCPSCKRGVGFHHGVGETDSRQLPPGLRRRLMSRTFESEVSGAHLGKQELSVKDRASENATKSFSAMYGLSGIMPESEGGWTE